MNILRAITSLSWKGKSMVQSIPRAYFSEELNKFTDVLDRKTADEQNKLYSTGRAWKADELRLKSTDDLHKLWYVLLIEKNKLFSDNAWKRKAIGSIGPQGRMLKVRVSMARLLTVISERKKVCDEYRKKIEDEYIAAQRSKYESKLSEETNKQSLEPYVPPITRDLIAAKFRDLKLGIDNTEYIKEIVQTHSSKTALKKKLESKYDYKNKKIVKSDETIPESEQDLTIRQFKSGIEEQLRSGEMKISQEEVLRSHVKNWKMLNLKQRRIILGFLNARRAKDAKSEFLKELNLLGQKIAYDNAQKRLKEEKKAP